MIHDMAHYTITEFARIMGVSRQAVHKRILGRYINATRVGRHWLISKKEASNWFVIPMEGHNRLIRIPLKTPYITEIA